MTPMRDWLLMQAKKLGIQGGSAYHGIAGFGRHGILYEQHYNPFQADLPVEIRFVCSEDEAYHLLDLVESEKLSLFYVLSPANFGITGTDKKDWATAMQFAN